MSDKIAVYARVSSNRQADKGTIESQLEYLRDYCKLNNLEIVREYHDEAVQGKTPLTQRSEGKRMLTDAKSGLFKTLLFYRLDRFCRSQYELLEAEKLLTELSVNLKSATENFDTGTANGRFFFSS